MNTNAATVTTTVTTTVTPSDTQARAGALDLLPATATYRQRQRHGYRMAAQFLDRMAALRHELAAYQFGNGDGPSPAPSFIFDGLMAEALGEIGTPADQVLLPGLAPAGRSWEACAAFAHALFGEQVLPGEKADDEDEGADAQVAFQIACAYMALPRHDPGKNFIMAAALAAYRAAAVKREQEAQKASTAAP